MNEKRYFKILLIANELLSLSNDYNSMKKLNHKFNYLLGRHIKTIICTKFKKTNQLRLRSLIPELRGKFQYFSYARMWTQRTPQKLDIVCSVSSLYLNNLAS